MSNSILSHVFAGAVGPGVAQGGSGQSWVQGPSPLLAVCTLTSVVPVLLRCGQQASTSRTATSWP